MATFIRDHGSVNGGNTSATTLARTLGFEVPAGRVLVAVMGSANNAHPTGLSKPAGETATWSRISGAFWFSSPNGGSVSVWVIKTTVPWVAGQVITATWAGAVAYRTSMLTEWSGLKAERRGTESTDSMAVGRTPPNLPLSVTGVEAGDLVLTVGSMYTAGDSAASFGVSAEGGTATVESTKPSNYDRLAPWYQMYQLWRGAIATGPGTRTATWTTYYGSPSSAFPAAASMIVIPAENAAPYAPVITSMAGGAVLNRQSVNRLAWTFTSPNAVDSQSKYDVRYRIAGTTTWTTVTQTTVDTYRDFAGGSLAAGNYEVQVRVYGALGKDSPWSASEYFTMADPPVGAIITYPANGQDVDQAEIVQWSTPDQDAYRFRRLGDSPTTPGTPNPAVVYESVEVNDPSARSRPVEFAVNNRTEHLQVQVKDNGLWQDGWTSVRINVSYTAPPVPTWSVHPDPSDGSLWIEITNPAPIGDAPAAVHNNIWINDGAKWIRYDVGVPLNGIWRYRLPVAHRDYGPTGLLVQSVAANGITSGGPFDVEAP